MGELRRKLRAANRAAAKKARFAVVLAEMSDCKSDQGIAYSYLAQAHIMDNRLPDAVKAATKAKEIFHDISDTRSESFVMALQAQVCRIRGELEEAINVATQALEMAEGQGWRS